MPAILDRKFEKFLGGPTQPHETLVYVTLAPTGRIVLNANVYELLGKPPAVYLHFSVPDNTIAIVPVESLRLQSAFPLKQTYSSGWYINAAPLCTHHGIRLDVTSQFISPEFRDGALHLKLSEIVAVGRTRTRQRKKQV